jgi:ribosomal small subunit protein bTHX
MMLQVAGVLQASRHASDAKIGLPLQLSAQGGNMGKGDRRSLRGKLYRGSYGKRRSHETNRPQRELQPPAAPATAKTRA